MSELVNAVKSAIESRVRNIHTAMPGRVESYDAGSQTASIVPMVIPTVPGADEDDGEAAAPLPKLLSVPVIFPRAGDFAITFPVRKGDTVLLIFAERDIGRWRATGERERPIVSTPHGISGAIAIPGLYPSGDALSGVDEDALFLGQPGGFGVRVTDERAEVGGDSDAAALASKVDAFFDAFVGAQPVAQDGGAAIQTAVMEAWGASDTTASAKLKLGG